MKHGTITAVFDKISYEITTLRCDKQCDGRHAIVEFTEEWKIDASRRDFTFNALYIDKNGYVYDYFDGVNDLRNGVLNYIGSAETRIQEDYQRILRAFRFQNKYCKAPLHSSITNLIKHFSNKITNLSGERIQTEIVKLFRDFQQEKTINLLNEFNRLNISQYIFLKKDVNYDILLNFPDKLNNIISNPWLKISLLLRYSNIDANQLRNRWHISNKNFTLIQSIANILIENDIQEKQKKYLYIYYEIKEIFLICYKIEKNINENLFHELYNLFSREKKPTFPINAQILIENGYKNKEISDNLKKSLKIWLENNCLLSKSDLLEEIKNFN